MILLEPRRMALHDYLNAFTNYELSGSTANTKILNLPFAHGRVSITYAEPGLAVMHSDIRLGEEMLLIRPQLHQPGNTPYDVMHYFAFTSIEAGACICSMSYGPDREAITGTQDIITYSRDDTPTLAAYPPQCHTNSIVIQVGGWWLAEHLPVLAAQYDILEKNGGIRHVNRAPLSSTYKLHRYRSSFDSALSYGDESSRLLVKDFLLHCHGLTYEDAAEKDATATLRGPGERIDALIADVMRNIHKPLPSLTQMSEQSGINVNTLRAGFMKHYGKSATDFFAGRQMAWAEEELRRGNGTIKSIGYSIGYHNLSHFSDAFRKYRGVLPSEINSTKSPLKNDQDYAHFYPQR